MMKQRILHRRDFVVPGRRVCNVSLAAGINMFDMPRTNNFVEDSEITKTHAIRYLRNSPWLDPDLADDGLEHRANGWAEMTDGLEKLVFGIGITENNRHVILQQSAMACVPSAWLCLLWITKKRLIFTL